MATRQLYKLAIGPSNSFLRFQLVLRALVYQKIDFPGVCASSGCCLCVCVYDVILILYCKLGGNNKRKNGSLLLISCHRFISFICDCHVHVEIYGTRLWSDDQMSSIQIRVPKFMCVSVCVVSLGPRSTCMNLLEHYRVQL